MLPRASWRPLETFSLAPATLRSGPRGHFFFQPAITLGVCFGLRFLLFKIRDHRSESFFEENRISKLLYFETDLFFSETDVQGVGGD